MVATAVVVRPRTGSRGLSSIALLAAVGFGVVAQGGYYAPQLAVLTALVGAAAAFAGRDAVSHPAVWGVAGVATVAVVSGAVAGDPGAAWSTVARCTCAAGAITVGRSLDAAERDLARAALLAGGVVVSALAWGGVAFHLQPLALVDGGLWRGASGLTYANATAAFLVALTLVGMAQLADTRRRAGVGLCLATFAALVGAGSTLSRGGGLGLAVGAAAIMVMLGWRRALAAWAPLGLGAAVAVAGLSLSMPATSRPHPLVAAGALAVGAAVCVAGRRLPERAAPWLLLGLLAVVPAVMTLTPGRWSASSPDRRHETAAAVAVVADHPLLGVSPGRYLLTWNDPVLGPREVQYAHDEYLQLLGETGAVGLAVALAAAVATGRSAWRNRRRDAAWCGPVAALVAFAVHSGLDFLWHIPLLLVLAGFLVGTVVTPARTALAAPAITST